MMCTSGACIRLIVVLIVMSTCHTLSATTLTISDTDKGYYTVGGQHNVSNLNYFVGLNGPEYRNFFVFDLAAVQKPIVSATLLLYEPSKSFPGFFSAAGMETYELRDVVTPIGILTQPTGDLISGLNTFDDLGEGVLYATHILTAAEMGTYISIPLNQSGVAAVNGVNKLIAFGGSMILHDQYPREHYAFAWSGYEPALLQLELVPEPGSMLLICVSACVLTLAHNRSARR